MSSLINKIEEKFSSNSTSNRDDEYNNTQKPTSEYSSGNSANQTTSSSLRSGDNTSVGSGYGQQTTSSKEGGPIYNGVDGHGSNTTTSTSHYGNQDTTDANRRVPGSWDTTDRTATGTSGLAQDSSKYGEAQRQPPGSYNSMGQQTGANTVTGNNTDATRSFGSGVTNGTGQTTSDHHYGRDAGIVGGTGAASLSAYEASKYSGTSYNTHHEPGRTRTYETSRGQDQGYGNNSNLSNVPYMNRDTVNNGQHNSSSRRFSNESSRMHGLGSTDPNPHSISDRALARKMGAAYEAGYRDALEHLRAEHHQQQQESYGRHGYSSNGAGNATSTNSGYHRDYDNGTYGTNNGYGANEKPKITDKLNPKKDADGDGKAGVMS